MTIPSQTFEVRIWLGDQADFFITVLIAGHSEAHAIARARHEILRGWPELEPHIAFSPGSAKPLGNAVRATPDLRLSSGQPAQELDRTAKR